MCITFENSLVIVENDLASLKILEAITTTGNNKITTTFDDVINVPYDGWFKLTAIEIPYEALYLRPNTYIYKNGKVYKILSNNELIKVSIEEIIEVNPRTTNLYYREFEFFNTDNLENCLISLNDVSINNCSKKSDPCNPQNCKRNHIWHLLNILDYLISCGNNEEAQSLLELFNNCFGWCLTNKYSCGCKKKCCYE